MVASIRITTANIILDTSNINDRGLIEIIIFTWNNNSTQYSDCLQFMTGFSTGVANCMSIIIGESHRQDQEGYQTWYVQIMKMLKSLDL